MEEKQIETKTQVSFIDTIKKIKNKEIDVENSIFLDNKGNYWVWSDEVGGFETNEEHPMFGDTYKEYLTDRYSELELADLTFIIIQSKDNNPNKQIATQEIINYIEELFIELDMEIDSCQGCMDNLDVALEKLNVYSDIVKFLGGDIQSHMQELVDNFYKKAAKQEKEKEKQQKARDNIIKKLPFPVMDLVGLDKATLNVLWKQNDKINEICEIIIEDKNKE